MCQPRFPKAPADFGCSLHASFKMFWSAEAQEQFSHLSLASSGNIIQGIDAPSSECSTNHFCHFILGPFHSQLSIFVSVFFFCLFPVLFTEIHKTLCSTLAGSWSLFFIETQSSFLTAGDTKLSIRIFELGYHQSPLVLEQGKSSDRFLLLHLKSISPLFNTGYMSNSERSPLCLYWTESSSHC